MGRVIAVRGEQEDFATVVAAVADAAHIELSKRLARIVDQADLIHGRQHLMPPQPPKKKGKKKEKGKKRERGQKEKRKKKGKKEKKKGGGGGKNEDSST